MNLIFQKNPSKRANVHKLLKHAFITGEDKLAGDSSSQQCMSSDEKDLMLKQLANGEVKDEEPVIDIGNKNIENSEYITNENNQKANVYIIPKEEGDQDSK